MANIRRCLNGVGLVGCSEQCVGWVELNLVSLLGIGWGCNELCEVCGARSVDGIRLVG